MTGRATDQATGARGFAGLALLISDVSADVAAAEIASFSRAKEVQKSTPRAPDSPKLTAAVAPAQPGPSILVQSGRTSGGLRMAGVIAGVIFAFFVLIDICSGPSRARPSQAGSEWPAQQPGAVSTAATRRPIVLLATQPIASVPGDRKIDVGKAPVPEPTHQPSSIATNPRLDESGLRWCQFQRARLQAATGLIDTSPVNADDDGSERAVTRVNGMVHDYNASCGQYQYLQSDLDRVQTDVSIEIERLTREGRAFLAPSYGQSHELQTALDGAARDSGIPRELLQAIVDVVRKRMLRLPGDRMGLMSVSEYAAQVGGINDRSQITQNIDAGTRALRFYLSQQGGDLFNSLVAYWLDQCVYEDTNPPADALLFARQVIENSRTAKR